jgi:hypothetical protein
MSGETILGVRAEVATGAELLWAEMPAEYRPTNMNTNDLNKYPPGGIDLFRYD